MEAHHDPPIQSLPLPRADNPLRVGVIAAGSIFYLQDEDRWHDRYRGAAVCRNPWIVKAFFNGLLGAARRNRETGMWVSIYFSGRSDTAVIRSLRDCRRDVVAVDTLILHKGHGLVRQPCAYPTLPDLTLWHVQDRQLCKPPVSQSADPPPSPEVPNRPWRAADSSSPPMPLDDPQPVRRQAYRADRRGRQTAAIGYHDDRPTIRPPTLSSEAYP